MKKYRQGDCLLIQIESFPKDLTKKDNVIAEGEAAGHFHKFPSNQVEVFKDKTGEQYIQVNEPVTELVHEEHDTMNVPQGKYLLIMQREFDVLSEVIRPVLD